jgi:hypothetical protein
VENEDTNLNDVTISCAQCAIKPPWTFSTQIPNDYKGEKGQQEVYAQQNVQQNAPYIPRKFQEQEDFEDYVFDNTTEANMNEEPYRN